MPYQTDILLRFYETETTYPSPDQKLQLASQSDLTEKQISDWFHNRRQKEKRKNVWITCFFFFWKVTDVLAMYGIRNIAKFTQAQKETLGRVYERTQYPTHEEKKHLSQELQLSEVQISNWFHHRRKKTKKQLNWFLMFFRNFCWTILENQSFLNNSKLF